MGTNHGDEDEFGVQSDVGGELIDRLFENPVSLSVNPADLLYKEQERAWETISYEPVQVAEPIRIALGDAAAQFHYIYLSQLMILGDITLNAPDVSTKRLSTFLAASRMRDVDAWGRYLALIQPETTMIAPSLQTYFKQLYQDENKLSRLAGLLFADVFRQAVGETLRVDDPTFQRLLERDIKEGRKNVRLTRAYLRRINAQLEETARAEVTMQIDRYVVLIHDIISERADTFETLNADPDEISDRATHIVDTFHDSLTEDAGASL